MFPSPPTRDDHKLRHCLTKDNAVAIALGAKFCHDGSVLVAIGEKSIFRLWEPANGQCLQTVQGHSDQIVEAAFSPWNKRMLVTASKDKTIKFWQINFENSSVTCFQTEKQQGHVYCLSFSCDGALLAWGMKNGLKIWDVRSSKCIKSVQTFKAVFHLTFSTNKHLAVCLDYNNIHIWDAFAITRIATIKNAHSDSWISSLEFSPDGNQLLSAGLSQSHIWKFWQVQTGKLLATHTFPQGQGSGCVKWLSSNKLAFCCADGSINLWDAATLQCSFKVCLSMGTDIKSFTFSPKEDCIAICSLGNLFLVNRAPGRLAVFAFLSACCSQVSRKLMVSGNAAVQFCSQDGDNAIMRRILQLLVEVDEW